MFVETQKFEMFAYSRNLFCTLHRDASDRVAELLLREIAESGSHPGSSGALVIETDDQLSWILQVGVSYFQLVYILLLILKEDK